MDVDQGRRRLDWHVCLGEFADAEYLTAAGRALATRAADDIEAFLGPDWLHRATNPPNRALMPQLTAYWPTLMGAPTVYVRAIGLWARLQLLVDDQVQGIGKLRANLRANPIRDEFRHGVAQARLAVQARLAGDRVVLEPAKQGGPGDLLLVRGRTEVFIEYRGLSSDQTFTDYSTQANGAMLYLRMMERRYGVYWAGELPPQPTDTWRKATEHAAERAAATQQAVEVTTNGAALTVTPGDAPMGTSLNGPYLQIDQGPRLIRALTRKAVQTMPAGAAWIWLEDHGALWPLAEFVRYPLARKLEVLAEALEPLFAAYPHVLGVVLTSDAMRLDGPVEAVTERHDRGTGYVRTLPDGDVRESLIVHRPLVVPEQYAILCQLCATEPAWLDGALIRLGVAGGVASLTTWRPAEPDQSRPRPRRSPSGLYLP